eukprot:5755278-Amphidinium_carterae.1
MACPSFELSCAVNRRQLEVGFDALHLAASTKLCSLHSVKLFTVVLGIFLWSFSSAVSGLSGIASRASEREHLKPCHIWLEMFHTLHSPRLEALWKTLTRSCT